MMILTAPSFITSFIKFLDNTYKANIPVYISFLYEFDCVETEEGTGFACYSPYDKSNKVSDKTDRCIIYLPLDVDMDTVKEFGYSSSEAFILFNLAHEYCHHLQFCRGIDIFDLHTELYEAEAEEFARDAVFKYFENFSFYNR